MEETVGEHSPARGSLPSGRPVLRAVAAIATAVALISSCRQAPLSPDTATPEKPATEVPPPPTSTQTPIPTTTPEPSPTATQAPRISVSQNTNCRSGPGVEYLFDGVLRVGEVAEVVARSPEPGFWFVTGAELPAHGCWLWGEFAHIEGELDPLPVYTAAPSPTPQVGFDVYVKSFERCKSTFYVVFAVKNVGGQRIWSGYVEVQGFPSRDTLFTARERHPFAATVLPVCPPDHGNELWPGETRYVHVPISDIESGSSLIGIITLCTADHQGGTCETEYSYFQVP